MTAPMSGQRLDPLEVAARIRAERVRLGLSQAEAAARLGVVRNSYRQLERQANPRLDTLQALVRLGMRVQAIAPELLEVVEPSKTGRASRR